MPFEQVPPSKRGSKRWETLMFFDVPRYIRVYDNGGSTIDRYTVVFTKQGGAGHPYVGMSSAPFHPQGFGQHGEGGNGPVDYPTYGHLGKKIVFADLPKDCQWLVICDYCDLWNLERDDHPLTQYFIHNGIYAIDGECWEAPRPPKGKFDSREIFGYHEEEKKIQPAEVSRKVFLMTGYNVSIDTITGWSIAARQRVLGWAKDLFDWAGSNEFANQKPEMPKEIAVIIDALTGKLSPPLEDV